MKSYNTLESSIDIYHNGAFEILIIDRDEVKNAKALTDELNKELKIFSQLKNSIEDVVEAGNVIGHKMVVQNSIKDNSRKDFQCHVIRTFDKLGINYADTPILPLKKYLEETLNIKFNDQNIENPGDIKLFLIGDKPGDSQQLYAVSNERVQKGEWFLQVKQGTLAVCESNEQSEALLKSGNAKRIIASSNDSLEVQLYNSQDGSTSYVGQVPEISQNFLKSSPEELNSSSLPTPVEYVNFLANNDYYLQQAVKSDDIKEPLAVGKISSITQKEHLVSFSISSPAGEFNFVAANIRDLTEKISLSSRSEFEQFSNSYNLLKAKIDHSLNVNPYFPAKEQENLKPLENTMPFILSGDKYTLREIDQQDLKELSSQHGFSYSMIYRDYEDMLNKEYFILTKEGVDFAKNHNVQPYAVADFNMTSQEKAVCNTMNNAHSKSSPSKDNSLSV